MTDFEQALKVAAEKSLLSIVSSGNWIENSYSNRFKIPAEMLADVYKLVDAQKLREQLARRLEAELADRIINQMAAEIATDVKQILSVKERREALRGVARDHMEAIMSAGKL